MNERLKTALADANPGELVSCKLPTRWGEFDLHGLVDPGTGQEHAAMSLGASRAMAIWRVTLPQIRPSLISAAFLAFISSFDELVVAMFLGGSNMTLPKKMFDNIVNEIDPTIAAVSVAQIILVTAVLIVVSKLGAGAAPAN